MPLTDRAFLKRSAIKVLIADDHPLIVAGLRRTLENLDHLEVVGEARSGPELLAQIERHGPDLVLMDLNMPGVTGVQMIERIRVGWPEVKTVVLSACDDRPTIDSALRAGASAYVLKSGHTVDIASILSHAASRAAGSDGSADAPQRNASDPEPALPTLSDRERAILSAIASGMTDSAIGDDLWISEQTIELHLRNIYRKLGVADRAGAVGYALEHRIA